MLMKFVPGPDFPTGGEIVGEPKRLRGFMPQVKGSFKIRARVEITKSITSRKMGIVIKKSFLSQLARKKVVSGFAIWQRRRMCKEF